MSIQPGNGYNFVSSSQGISLDVDKPWSPPIGDALVFAPQFGNVTALPEQLVYGQGSGTAPSPFEARIVAVNGQRFLQIAVGSISYTSSPMPIIKSGADTRIMQAYANKLQICPSGIRTYGDIYPSFPFFDPIYFLTEWMEDGGGYLLSDTSNPVTLYAFKWDVAPGVAPFSSSSVVNTGLPTLALVSDADAASINKIAVDPGPSVYVQTMNVQKMTGYDHASTGLPLDWGYCHTSWLNPRKLGYSYKAVFAITPEANTFSMASLILRPGIPLLQNQIQQIDLFGEASGGFALISCGASVSVIPFPVTDFFDPIAPVSSDEVALAACLNSMPPITLTVNGDVVVIPFTGNVEVSRMNATTYFVTFCNQLQGLTLPQLVFVTAGVTAYQYKFNITQYITGNIDLTTPMQTGMVQLRNVENEDESTDPYNVNFTASWNQIVNKAECVACTGFSGDVTTDGMFGMTQATTIPVDYDGGDCTNEPLPNFSHPYKVYLSSSGGGSNVFGIIYGETNNVAPTNIGSLITVANGAYEVFIKHPYLSPNYPDTTGFVWDIDVGLPGDTDTEGYIRIATISGMDITQIVTGSLWSDRIKLGTVTAEYYFARV